MRPCKVSELFDFILRAVAMNMDRFHIYTELQTFQNFEPNSQFIRLLLIKLTEFVTVRHLVSLVINYDKF